MDAANPVHASCILTSHSSVCPVFLSQMPDTQLTRLNVCHAIPVLMGLSLTKLRV